MRYASICCPASFVPRPDWVCAAAQKNDIKCPHMHRPWLLRCDKPEETKIMRKSFTEHDGVKAREIVTKRFCSSLSLKDYLMTLPCIRGTFDRDHSAICTSISFLIFMFGCTHITFIKEIT